MKLRRSLRVRIMQQDSPLYRADLIKKSYIQRTPIKSSLQENGAGADVQQGNYDKQCEAST